jgi:hypothetical protein
VSHFLFLSFPTYDNDFGARFDQHICRRFANSFGPAKDRPLFA